MTKVAVLIPCYNEELTIKAVIEDAFNKVKGASIYVYDNNSSDKTAKIAKEAGATVVNSPLKGKGNVIKQMFKEIDADVYITIDGDNTYNLKEAQNMINKIVNEDVDMVIGDRLTSSYFQNKKNGRFHHFGNRLVRFLVNHLYHQKYTDIMTGLRALSPKFVKNINVVSKGFEIETELSIYAAKHKLKVDTIEIEYQDRPEGSYTKTKALRDGFKIVWMIFRLKFKRNY